MSAFSSGGKSDRRRGPARFIPVLTIALLAAWVAGDLLAPAGVRAQIEPAAAFERPEPDRTPPGSPGEDPIILRTWHALGTGVDRQVRALAVHNDDLFAGGDFLTAGGSPAHRVARWDGTSWYHVGSGFNGPVVALLSWNGSLIAAGDFSTAAGAVAHNIALWNGSSWQALAGGINGPVHALAIYDGKLAVGGSFSIAGGVAASNVALWDGVSWSSVGSGTDGPVYALASYHGLVAGGSFAHAGGSLASNIAQWDALSWGAVGGTNLPVRALLTRGNKLFVGGDFTAVAGLPSNHIARWNGTSWHTEPVGLDGPVYALALFDGAVAVGGRYGSVDHIPAGNITIMRGQSWETIRPGTDDQVNAVVEFEEGLVAGGLFKLAGGLPVNRAKTIGDLPVNHIARWACDIPVVPTGVTATTDLCNQIRVGWDDVEGETGYKLLRDGTLLADLGAGVTGYDDHGITGSARYSVIAYNSCGESPSSRTARGSTQGGPPAPGWMTASDTSCSIVHLEWGAVAEATRYRILRGGHPIGTVSGFVTSYDDHPSPGVYSYQVQAGNDCSWSGLAGATGAAIPPPDPPGSVTASDTSCSVVYVVWSASQGADGYRVYRDDGLIATVGAGVLSYVDSPAPGSHTYGVASGGGCGYSDPTTDAGRVIPIPAAPAQVTASDTSCSLVRVDWSDVIDAESFRLYRNGALVATFPATAGSYVDTLPPGEYVFGVSAGTACGWSSAAEDAGKVLPATPAAAANLVASDNYCTGVNLTWEPSALAESYDVYRDGGLIAIVPSGVMDYFDTVPQGTYAYTVVARSKCGVSDPVAATGSVLPENPGPATELDASDTSCTAVYLTWTLPEEADSCRLFRDNHHIATLSAEIPGYTDSGATGSHVYQIEAGSKCGWSGKINVSGSILPGAPGAPSVFAASDTSCSVVRLDWSAVTNADSFVLQRNGGPIATLPATTLSYEDKVSGGSYLYTIYAENECGASPNAEAFGFVLPAPGVPLDFQASDSSCTIVRLDWEVSLYADSFRVYREGARIASLGGAVTSYVDSGLSGSYVYEVEAGNRCAWSGRAAATGTIRPGMPIAPAGLEATTSRCDSIVLTWEDRSSDEEGFEIFRDALLAGTTGPDATRFADRVDLGVYDYQVRAVGSCGRTESPHATGERVAPPAAPLLVTPEEGATLPGTGPIVLSWNASAGADAGYRLQIALAGDFTSPEADTVLPAGNTFFVIPFDLGLDEYAWRVASLATCGPGGFSGPRHFTREPVGGYEISNREVDFGHDPLGGPAGSDPVEPDPNAVVIRNDGEKPFAWDAVPTDLWIEVDPDTGFLGVGEAETLWVAVRANEVLGGDFSGDVLVHTNLDTTEQDTIDVALSVKQYPLGDCNGSGDLDEMDIAALVDHLGNALPLWSAVVRLGLADVNGDDGVGEADLDEISPLIGTALLGDRPEADPPAGGEEAVLWIGTGPDSFLVSLEGTGDLRAGAFLLQGVAKAMPDVHVTALPGSPFAPTLIQNGAGVVGLFYTREEVAPRLDGENRIDLFSLKWDGEQGPAFDFVWGGIAPSGSERYPIVRVEWYELGGPGSWKFAFFPIRPNPFSERCIISYELPAATDVTFRAYSIGGRLVRTVLEGRQPPGFHEIMWDGRNDEGRRVGLGVYFIKLVSPRGNITRRTVIVR